MSSPIFPPTTIKVNQNTKPEINKKIKDESAETIAFYSGKSVQEIQKKIMDLNYEWDTERVLEINFASIVLLSFGLGVFKNKRWFNLAGIAAIFMLQHTLQGWCPPLPIIRRFGIRTAAEILNEKNNLESLLDN